MISLPKQLISRVANTDLILMLKSSFRRFYTLTVITSLWPDRLSWIHKEVFYR